MMDFALVSKSFSAFDPSGIPLSELDLRSAAIGIYAQILAGPHNFLLMKDYFERRYVDADFVTFLLRVYQYLNSGEQYSVSVSISHVHMLPDEVSLLKFWAAALVDSRGASESRQLDGIGAERAAAYDANPLHIDSANKLAFFALAGSSVVSAGRGARILDIGCGSGLMSVPLGPFSRELVGIDIELSGLRSSPLAKRYTRLVEGPAEECLFDLEGQFDFVVICSAIYFFDKLDWLFVNADRLLAPSGLIAFNGWPCPEAKDAMLTGGGNRRWCHSERYLREIAGKHNFNLTSKVWTSIYNLPSWLLRFERKGL